MLSQQLIENASALCEKTMDFVMNTHIAIYEYQSGNEKPLIELLSKINGK